ncbi:DUF2812 domain-containing protein [Gordonia zhaorongruii]|uniref:DUF2812 domain-containing protein n=1 Tax=Gordonia zhaorongruii TaxID=2597659 RepID=UPI0010442922|nr:DUF2812 domain-containing protein [Gordonia zhaorongruii]
MSATNASAWLVPVRHPSPDDLELYLEGKAAEGQILDVVDATSPVRMRFRRGTPATMRFAVERRDEPIPAHYYRTRTEMGWEHVGSLSAIQVWRREYSGERPEGFIGEDLGRRAVLHSVGLGVVAAVAILGAIITGVLAGVTDFGFTQDLWIATAVFGVIAVVAGGVSLALGLSRRSAVTSTPPAPADNRTARV